MADPLTVVGIVANIVQLADFSTKVLARLDDFQSNLGEIPKEKTVDFGRYRPLFAPA
jgi:hypothetical protein